MNSPKLSATPLQQTILRTIAHQTTASVCEVERATLILAMLQGKSNAALHTELGYSWAKARRWRYRWIEIQPGLDTIETATDSKKVRYELEKAIRDGLGDAERSGSPGKFTAHDYCQIMGVSLEEPALSGRPISHWGLTELTQEVIKRGIVASISRSQVGSFLKRERDQAPQDSGLAQP